MSLFSLALLATSIALALMVVNKLRGGAGSDQTSNMSKDKRGQLGVVNSVDLPAVRARVPGFGRVPFVETARELFLRAQQARAGDRWHMVDEWLSIEAIETLMDSKEPLDEVRNLIPSCARIVQTSVGPDSASITAEFQSLQTECRGPRNREIERTERWYFAWQCEGDPRFPWEVQSIEVTSAKTLERPDVSWDRAPVDLKQPPHIDPLIRDRITAFESVHPGHSWPQFEQGVRAVFQSVQTAISEQDPGPIERVVDAQAYDEIAAYAYRYNVRGLSRRKTDPTIHRVTLCRVEMDDRNEVVVVRIQASLKDWVEDESGRLHSGDRDTPRELSEYWTFARHTDGISDWRLHQIDAEEQYAA